ncbi:MAG: hypothetical protein VXW32_12700 [Myxococcota bacterium]|nr:hypothetical protein [Myxococcota bacterium]
MGAPLTATPKNDERPHFPEPAHAAAALLSLGFAWLMLASTLKDPGTRLVGNWMHPDCLGNHWLLVWVAERALGFESLLHNSSYYAPFGDAPWLAGNGSQGLFYSLFHSVLDWPESSTAYLFFVCAFNNISAYVLARCLNVHRWSALILLAVIGCSPYLAQELSSGRFSQADLGFFLLSIALFFRLLEHPSRSTTLLLGLCGALTSLLYFYYGFFLLLIGLPVLLIRRLQGDRIPGELLRACGLALVLLLPLLGVFMAHWEGIPGSAEPFPHPESYGDSSGASLKFFLFGEARFVGFCQSLPVLLLFFSALLRWPLQKFSGLLLAGALAWWLCLGPNAGLYNWIYGLHPFLERFWWPYRHAIIVTTLLGAVACFGLPKHIADKKWPVLLIVTAIPISLEIQGVRYQAKSSVISLPHPLYEKLHRLEGDILLQTPLHPQRTTSQVPLIAQLTHQKRLINGHAPWVDRVRPAAWDALLESNSFFSALIAYETGEASGDMFFEPSDLTALQEMGLRHLVVDQELYVLPLKELSIGTRKAFQRLFGPPVIQEKRSWVFDIQNWRGESFLRFDAWSPPADEQLERPGQPMPGRRLPSQFFPPHPQESP